MIHGAYSVKLTRIEFISNLVERTCRNNWNTEALACLLEDESDGLRGEVLDALPSGVCVCVCVCVCVWLMVTISGAEISGSSIVQLTTTRKLHLISYSCIAPLHYSTDPAGMSYQ